MYPANWTKRERWEARLKAVFDRIDRELESIPSLHPFPRHPARPPHASTANPEDDGLFDIGASFTPGAGSRYGPGYVLSVRIATLAPVPNAKQKQLESFVVKRLRAELPKAFPHANLHVRKDGRIYKIYGNLSLDDA